MLITFSNSVPHEMDYPFRHRYETLRSLLNKNGNALQIMSDLEADLNHMRHYDERIKRPIIRLITEALLMAQELNMLTKDRYSDLYKTIIQLRNETERIFETGQISNAHPKIVMVDPAKLPDSNLVGGKAAGFWQLSRDFGDAVLPGFVVTTAAYKQVLEANDLHERIRLLLNDLDVTKDQDRFQSRTRTIRKWIRDARLPEEIEKEIFEFSGRVAEQYACSSWAVRSSAVSEDSTYSFAGQFDTELLIETKNLISAYKNVLASRFTDRAVKYRLHVGLREVDTPMAVLFMPMIDPVAAGVVYTRDVHDADSNNLVINSVPGLANKMVKGEVLADTFIASKGASSNIQKTVPAVSHDAIPSTTDYIQDDTLLKIARMAEKAVEIAGYDLDIEWAVDRDGKIWLLQQRQLKEIASEEVGDKKPGKRKDVLPILEGGITIFPGRAEGPVYYLEKEADIPNVPEASVVLVEKPGPELAPILPKIAALIALEGNPVGHLAALVREFSVPCIFRMGQKATLLADRNVVSINATKRRVYSGPRWPGMRERVLARITSKEQHKKSGPLYDLVLKLTLLDPDASSFKPKSCTSIHDTLRFMHEMAVRSMFGFGDKHKRGWHKKTRVVQTGLPLKFQLIPLDDAVSESNRKVKPHEVCSIPFNALWAGISDKRLHWPERWDKEMMGMPQDFREAVLGGNRGPRRSSDTNYAIVAKDYLNINARFAYHYAMVDAMVGPGMENNHVHFRFRGGGGSDPNRLRRAKFLEMVLREKGFGVEQQGDLVTAWLRRYSQKDSETALQILGRLMVCARQLDVVLRVDSDVKRYAAYFLEERYDMFS